MASIFDFDPPAPSKPDPESETPTKRSKHRETLSNADVNRAKKTLSEMVEQAFDTLREAMAAADHPTAVKAAQILLDRAGFGPKSNLDVTTFNYDLSSLSKDELADRALQIATRLRDNPPPPAVEKVN